ncbi:MAG: YIP1 family protein [Granulosicoccus sp.]|nr:YIP1 family protein [Granulosicoccus sp.]
MLLNHIKGLLFNPLEEWEEIRSESSSVSRLYSQFILIVAAIAPVCALIGTTTLGWKIGVGEPVRLVFAAALQMAVAFYLAILVATFCIGKTIHWMSKTYGAEQPLHLCMALACYSATPLFLVGFIQLLPTLWINFIVGLPALAYTVYLLYSGVPIVMQIPKERGYLFSTSILAVGLVTLVGLLAVTAGLWGIGIGPRFT